MKKLLYLFLLFSVAACDDASQLDKLKSKEQIPLGPEVEIENYVNNNPKWSINDAVKEESSKTLMERFKVLFSKGEFTLSMPFKFDGIEQYAENGKTGYVASFEFDHTKMQGNRLASRMHMQIIGLVNGSMKDTLVQGKDYFINGKFIMYRSGFAILGSGPTVKYISELYLPTARMKIESISPVNDSL